MGTIRTKCPRCQNASAVPEFKLDRSIKCSECRGKFQCLESSDPDPTLVAERSRRAKVFFAGVSGLVVGSLLIVSGFVLGNPFALAGLVPVVTAGCWLARVARRIGEIDESLKAAETRTRLRHRLAKAVTKAVPALLLTLA